MVNSIAATSMNVVGIARALIAFGEAILAEDRAEHARCVADTFDR